MHTLAVAPEISESTLAATKTRLDQTIDDVMVSLPGRSSYPASSARDDSALYSCT